jgi:uncharacterized protein YbjT (DUF2867 family)
MESVHAIFITGGTGYMGRRLVPELLKRGHSVRALVRAESEQNLPPGCTAIVGNALERSTYVDQIKPSDTFVQLVGVPKPSPSKAAQFRSVDSVSAREAIAAATENGIEHFVYLSVAQPAPAMKAYVEARAECEALLRASRLNATILRPWYVLGPGHRWPYALKPLYWLCAHIPATRAGALRLGLVTLQQMVNALVWSVEHPCHGQRVITVPEIRSLPTL